MKAPRLYYIRHGETDWNRQGRLQGRQDTPLNGLGRQQAEACGDIVQGLMAREGRAPTDYSYVSSPLRRALETMEIVRVTLGLDRKDYAVDARLREIEFGDWEGWTLAEVRSHDAAGLAARERDKWEFKPPGGESYAEVSRRMAEWYAGLSGDTVVVAHGGTARALIEALGIASPETAPLIEIAQGVVYCFADKKMTRHS